MTTTRPTARVILTAAALPLISTVASVVLLQSWRPRLPDPIVTHWGLGGTANGFSSFAALLWIVLITGIIGLGVAVAAGWSSTASLARTIGGMAAGTVVFVQVLMLVSTAAQRDSAGSATADFSGWWILVGAAAGLVAGALTALAMPRWQGAVVQPGTSPAALALADNERAVWSSAVSSGRAGTVVVAAAIAVTIVLTVVTAMWWMLTIPVVLTVLVVAMMSIRVTVDPTGLHVRGRLGWPRTSVPVERIAAVSVVKVNALRDFGGWGYRVAVTGHLKGAKGFVLHSGPAILVTTTEGRSEVTVVEDAATGAALLEAYRQRVAR